MRSVAALLAAVALAAIAGCGDDGAEPGAPREATLVLDFQPNAVHAGIYAALEDGLYDEADVALTLREPSASTDAPKLLEAGRADFAILDIHDLGIARERGLDVVGLAPIVTRPLAAVIAGDAQETRHPCDLEGGTVGVTGLPSDEAVLQSVLEADGCGSDSVDAVTIGFNAVAALAAGRVDAATAFWNAEGVALRRQGVPTRVFRVDDFGAPRYPELVLVTSGSLLADQPDLADDIARATERGYAALLADPTRALDALLEGASGLDREEQEAQLDALLRADAFSPPALDVALLRAWAAWDSRHGILEEAPDPREAFSLPGSA